MFILRLAARAPCLRGPVSSTLDGINRESCLPRYAQRRDVRCGGRSVRGPPSEVRAARKSKAAAWLRIAQLRPSGAERRKDQAPNRLPALLVLASGGQPWHLAGASWSAALTSCGVRGRASRSCAVPIPSVLRRCFWAGSLPAGRICLQFTRCAGRLGVQQPLFGSSGSKSSPWLRLPAGVCCTHRCNAV